jgi:hypothetical protein
MKLPIPLVAAALLFAAIPSRAGVIAGPITNPANGHDYYLLTPNSWSASEAEAENLGGTLAILRNAAENEWVSSKFGAYGGVKRNLWIGLRRSAPGGAFAWVTDEKPDYLNWHPGQPDNGGGIENGAHIWGRNPDRPDAWNDLFDNYAADDQIPCGVVEVPGKSKERSLTQKEKELIGTWYASGNREHPCWIAGTENKLFQIYDGRATRLIFTVEGPLFLANGIRGEIVKDRILWHNGTWWSRKPAEYLTADKSEAGHEQ